MSRITMIAAGSRGDVQPAIALGVALQRAGHAVRICAGADFRDWIEANGVEAAPARTNITAFMATELGRRWVESGRNPLLEMRLTRAVIDALAAEQIADAWEACADADVVVSGLLSDPYAVAMAEKRQVPAVSTILQPALFATRDGRAMTSAPFPHRTTRLNWLFGKLLLERYLWYLYGAHVKRFRATIGLPDQTGAANTAARRRMTVLHGISRHVLTLPPEWPANFHVTGYWFLDDGREWQPPAELLEFLADGPRPVCISFGSMVGVDPAGSARLVAEAVELSGQRAIVLTGSGGIGGGSLPPSILRLPEARHDWLLPRMAAVVHHGGAGTTAAAFRAGTPSVVLPHMGDQFYWARRVADLGVGPRPLPRHGLTASRLAAAIKSAANDPEIRRKANALASAIRDEDGTAIASEMIGRVLAKAADPQSRGGRGSG